MRGLYLSRIGPSVYALWLRNELDGTLSKMAESYSVHASQNSYDAVFQIQGKKSETIKSDIKDQKQAAQLAHQALRDVVAIMMLTSSKPAILEDVTEFAISGSFH